MKKTLLYLEIALIIFLFTARFVLATAVSLNYRQNNFYQNYIPRLQVANNHLELVINQKNNLNNLQLWAQNQHFEILSSYLSYQDKQILAQR